VAIQSLLKAGFPRAVQVELVLITRYKWIASFEFQDLCDRLEFGSETCLSGLLSVKYAILCEAGP
jgi:hypothetical protein